MSPDNSTASQQEVEEKAEPGSKRLDDPERETFCQELVATGDLYAAFETAGFKRPRGNAQRMLRESDVAERIGFLYRKVEPLEHLLIAHRRHEHRKALEHIATADRLELFREQTRYITAGKRKKKITTLALKPLGELTEEQRALIDSIEIDDKGKIKVTTPKRLDARAMLAKLDGLEAPQKVAPTNPEGDAPYDPGLLTDEQRVKALEALLAKRKPPTA